MLMHSVETMLSGWRVRQEMMITDIYNTNRRDPQGLFLFGDHYEHVCKPLLWQRGEEGYLDS